MKYGVISFLWMHAICYWGGLGNMTENSSMMEERIPTPFGRMDRKSSYFPLRMMEKLRIYYHKEILLRKQRQHDSAMR
jgi:hypothetical protein